MYRLIVNAQHVNPMCEHIDKDFEDYNNAVTYMNALCTSLHWIQRNGGAYSYDIQLISYEDEPFGGGLNANL